MEQNQGEPDWQSPEGRFVLSVYAHRYRDQGPPIDEPVALLMPTSPKAFKTVLAKLLPGRWRSTQQELAGKHPDECIAVTCWALADGSTEKVDGDHVWILMADIVNAYVAVSADLASVPS